MQKVMLRVCAALLPLMLAAVYLYGWRSLVMVILVFFFGIVTEASFTFREGKPVSSAVFVTCLIFSLSLPPRIPFWMAAAGIIFGVALGKMVFGGFGQNVFNPAMVGRCFIYITFPREMTNQWVDPIGGPLGGFGEWSIPFDAITRATPLTEIRNGVFPPLRDLFLGLTAGSMGETSALLILIGGAYILYKKAAPWRLALSCLLGGLILNLVLLWAGSARVPPPLVTLLSGSFLFGIFFVVTEPISGPKTKQAQWFYGFMIGGLTVALRAFSNFSEGFMFSVLLMNAFVPIMDQTVGRIFAKRAEK
ncbi:MAG: RnfABCDGE type electron transport complex subunit D [Pseudomonadota bacterium]